MYTQKSSWSQNGCIIYDKSSNLPKWFKWNRIKDPDAGWSLFKCTDLRLLNFLVKIIGASKWFKKTLQLSTFFCSRAHTSHPMPSHSNWCYGMWTPRLSPSMSCSRLALLICVLDCLVIPTGFRKMSDIHLVVHASIHPEWFLRNAWTNFHA